ncbi:MAG: LysR family transcriptional regulator [Burkholderiaceae bacterium]
MDTSFLMNYIDVIEKGSIAEVARINGLTPAAVNQRIKKVEDELGVRLVVRSGRTVKATAQGAIILAQAKRVIEELNKLKAASEGPIVFGRLSLGAFDSAMSTMIPPMMQLLASRYPDLEISLVKAYSGQLYSKVCDDEIDAAVAIQPHFQLPKNIEWRSLRKEPLIVLAPASIHERDPHRILRENPLICYERKLWGGQLAENYLRQHGIRAKIRIELATIEVIARLVRAGLGVSLIPDVAGDLLRDPTLRRISLPDAGHVRHVGLLWNRHSIRATLIEEIYQMARTINT